MSVTEAARNFSDVINRAHYRRESVLLLKNGQPVARIVPAQPSAVTGAELAKMWENMPHLDKGDAAQFEQELKAARKSVRKVKSPWE